MEELLATFSRVSAQLIEAAAVIVVAFASLASFFRLAWTTITGGIGQGQRKALWQRYGMWLLLGLEFELAADIIRSVVSPTWKDLGELGAIAVIRTFLNYFLEKDLESASGGEGAPRA